VGAVAVRHDPASAALVRRVLSEELSTTTIGPDRIADVVLVASELVGNAVVHTDSGDLDIGWTVEATAVTVWVSDASPVIPEQRVADAADTSGRGLAIVAAVAAEWGVEPLGTGKRVWARVAV